ncbi:MAG: hypothetical protein ACE5JT_02265 [Nitrosopumilaceae archaeon]
MLVLLSNNFALGTNQDQTILKIDQPFVEKQYEISVEQQVMITADISNGQDREQQFAYLVQIKNENGLVVSLSWLTGTLAVGQSFTPAQSWTPTVQGTFIVEIFVWESVDNPTALSPPLAMKVDVV